MKKGNEYDEEYLLKPYRYLSFPWLSKAERYVIYLYAKHFKGDEELLGKLPLDKSMIREYDKAFSQGLQTSRSWVEDILSGRVKMNVLNKCRLIGFFSSSFYPH